MDRNEKEIAPLDTERTRQLHEKICAHFKEINDPRIDIHKKVRKLKF